MGRGQTNADELLYGPGQATFRHSIGLQRPLPGQLKPEAIYDGLVQGWVHTLHYGRRGDFSKDSLAPEVPRESAPEERRKFLSIDILNKHNTAIRALNKGPNSPVKPIEETKDLLIYQYPKTQTFPASQRKLYLAKAELNEVFRGAKETHISAYESAWMLLGLDQDRDLVGWAVLTLSAEEALGMIS